MSDTHFSFPLFSFLSSAPSLSPPWQVTSALWHISLTNLCACPNFFLKAIQEHKRARMGLCMRVNKVSELWKRHKPQRSKLFLVSCRDTPFAVSQAHIAHTFYEKLEQNVKCGTDTDTIFPRMWFSFECVSFPRPVHRIIVPILTSQRIKAVKGCKNSHILYKVIYSIVTYIQI